ncbi:MAG: phosphatidylglycerophosphatase A [Gammaproteobacteria bacterium]|tara:strand:- start:15430 stop:15888 length:459 start_codon:yes stop_codon:yes gene_type:complete
MTNILVKFLVTGFYSGKIKYMPGTFGTLVGVLIFQLISLNSLLNNIFLLLVLFFLSLLLLNYSYKKSIFLNKDDKSIVIDEIFGYLIFMIFFENNPTNLLVGFMLFRFFDILKPFPISLIDKNIKNSFGVMFDDVIAALFSGVGLFLFNYVY